MRIFGPWRSAMMATVHPRLCATSRTIRARSWWSLAAPCEKFRRTTSTPAAIIRVRTSGVLLAGPSVATIFVARCMEDSWVGAGALARGARFEYRDRRQRLAFEKFEEGAASRRYIADPVRDAELVDRGDRDRKSTRL